MQSNIGIVAIYLVGGEKFRLKFRKTGRKDVSNEMAEIVDLYYLIGGLARWNRFKSWLKHQIFVLIVG